MQALIGDSFIDAKGNKYALKDIVKPETKYVGLYFSASWCPPCRRFTPELAKSYTQHLKAKGLEIIFLSRDRDEASFNSYLAEMPWYALPYADRDTLARLASKYKLSTIPFLVILEPNGKLVTDKARMDAVNDPTGKNFPWRPKSVVEILKEGSFANQEGKQMTYAELSAGRKAIGLYFSASWCGPCRNFTPKLAECYEHLGKQDAEAKRDKRLEIILIPGDSEKEDFAKYYSSMPWPTLEFSRSDINDALNEHFGVLGIPFLVVFDPVTGDILNADAVGAVVHDVKGDNFPWAPKPVEILNGASASLIGPAPALMVFCNNNDKAKEVQADLSQAVDVWRGKVEEGAVCHGDVCIPTGGKLDGAENVLFFVCGEDPVVQKIHALAKTEDTVVAILDLSGPVYAHAQSITSIEKATPMAIRKFLKEYLEGKVEKVKVSQ